jgi:uncharacterized protein YbjT (DUF2867 family)
MKSPVTAAAGFIGSHLCERLLRPGSSTILALRGPESAPIWEGSA